MEFVKKFVLNQCVEAFTAKSTTVSEDFSSLRSEGLIGRRSSYVVLVIVYE